MDIYEHVIDCSGTTAVDIAHTGAELAPLRAAQAQALARRQAETRQAQAVQRLQARAHSDPGLADILTALGLGEGV